jgi:hypothetical protein
MDLQGMILQFVLARERSIAARLTTGTPANWAPEDSLLRCMSAIVVSVEVEPSGEGSMATAFGVDAVEDEDIRIAGGLDGADLGGGRLSEGCRRM